MADDDDLLFSGKKPTRERQQADYRVGYGKPPAETQFKPGQSGNPKGRPRRSAPDIWRASHATLLDIVRMVADERVTIVKNGKRRNLRFVEGFIVQMAANALKDPAFTKVFLSLVRAAEKAKPPLQLYDYAQLSDDELVRLRELLAKAAHPDLSKK